MAAFTSYSLKTWAARGLPAASSRATGRKNARPVRPRPRWIRNCTRLFRRDCARAQSLRKSRVAFLIQRGFSVETALERGADDLISVGAEFEEPGPHQVLAHQADFSVLAGSPGDSHVRSGERRVG